MESMWQRQTIDLGEMVEGTRYEAIFKLKYPGAVLRDYKPSCSCTAGMVNKSSNDLRVSYKAETFPKHLTGINRYTILKTIKTKVLYNGVVHEEQISIKGYNNRK